MNAMTRKAGAAVALRAATRLWNVLMNSERAELVEAGERVARAATDLHRAMSNKDKARSSAQTRQALVQLAEAVKAAGAMLAEARRSGSTTDHSRPHLVDEPELSAFDVAAPVDEAFWETVPAGDH